MQEDACFTTTHWTLLEQIRTDDTALREEATNRVVERYWPPVYAYARHLTGSREAAVELTQAFFAEVVLGRGLLEQADRHRGRLRSLLRTSLRRFATDQWRREAARGNGITVPLGDLDREEALSFGDDEVSAFDRRWALEIFQESLRRCAAHFERTGKASHWRLFETRVVGPTFFNTEPPGLAAAAVACDFESAAAGAAAVQTVKRCFATILREVVAETVSDPSEAAAEYEEVIAALGRGG